LGKQKLGATRARCQGARSNTSTSASCPASRLRRLSPGSSAAKAALQGLAVDTQRAALLQVVWRAPERQRPGPALQWWLDRLESAATCQALLGQR
jgi:hypothetical protein